MRTRRSGYTLVEFLIYIGISAILMLVCTDIVFTLLSGKAKLGAVQEVSQNGRNAMERMRLAIRNANAVTTPSDGATSTNLVLQMPAPSTNPTIFALQNGVITMQEGTGASTSLMANNVTVPSILFRNLSTSTAPDAIRIQMTVSSTNPTNDPDFAFGQTLYGNASVRRRP